ncbi:MAG TPA: HDIG domain-containing protein [Pyrinomonadaceae bacterium]|nr:HDIG domain-containing protein [Pyrinomonadaceae bacterium]
MSPRPRFTSTIDNVRNAVLGVLLPPLRWFSPATQFGIGFLFLIVTTTLLLSHWPFRIRTLVVLAIVAVAYFFVWRFAKHRAGTVDLLVSPARAFALVGSAILFETALMRVGFEVANAIASQSTREPFNEPSVWSFAIPFAAAALLLTMLLDRQLSLVAGIVSAGFAGLFGAQPSPLILYAFISCTAAVYGLKRYRERQSVTLAGLFVAAANCVTAVALTTFAYRPLSVSAALVAGLFGIGGGLLTIIFAAGGVPINESLFGILTDIRLLELTNADLPVLSQLALRAPGTNQHSHAVGQLAEDACRAIRANALLARVGALYHDIGKVAAPEHFVENQTGENPHDCLKPLQSAKIITSHVTFGLRLAKEIGLPKRIADFIPQHHGTRSLHFFLRKAEAQANGAKINEADFRYPGPKPQFREAAILMLVDSAEAAARSLAHPSQENIRAIVSRIFDAVLSDGQLDESNLTLRELSTVREAIINSLLTIYHPRIGYPGFNAALPAEAEAKASRFTYETAAEVPINPSGEVEEEAISQTDPGDQTS